MTGVRAYASSTIGWERLAAFLGDRFDDSLTDYGTCCEFVDDEFARLGDAFYLRGIGYLYDLTHFHFSPHKNTFFDVVLTSVRELGLRDIADVGCGVGLDAQALLAQEYDVTLYDLDGPCLEYARWRLRLEGLGDARVRTLDRLGDERHDLLYAVDTLEHVRRPAELIDRLFDAGRYVCINLFDHDPAPWDGKDLHFPLDHRTLLPAMGGRGDLIQLAVTGATVTTLWRART